MLKRRAIPGSEQFAIRSHQGGRLVAAEALLKGFGGRLVAGAADLGRRLVVLRAAC